MVAKIIDNLEISKWVVIAYRWVGLAYRTVGNMLHVVFPTRLETLESLDKFSVSKSRD